MEESVHLILSSVSDQLISSLVARLYREMCSNVYYFTIGTIVRKLVSETFLIWVYYPICLSCDRFNSFSELARARGSFYDRKLAQIYTFQRYLLPLCFFAVHSAKRFIYGITLTITRSQLSLKIFYYVIYKLVSKILKKVKTKEFLL